MDGLAGELIKRMCEKGARFDHLSGDADGLTHDGDGGAGRPGGIMNESKVSPLVTTLTSSSSSRPFLPSHDSSLCYTHSD